MVKMEMMLMNHPRDLKNLCLFEIAFILVYFFIKTLSIRYRFRF